MSPKNRLSKILYDSSLNPDVHLIISSSYSGQGLNRRYDLKLVDRMPYFGGKWTGLCGQLKDRWAVLCPEAFTRSRDELGHLSLPRSVF